MNRGIVFPSDPFEPRKVDEEFRAEAEIVKSLGGKVVLVDHTELGNNVFKASNVAKPFELHEYAALVSEQEREDFVTGLGNTLLDGSAFYRGWMMPENTYGQMERALDERRIRLMTNKKDYAKALYFYGWYHQFEEVTPRSVWFPVQSTVDRYLDTVRDSCGKGPFFVKDLVKSRKHEWETACFAPNLNVLPDIIANLVELQGNDISASIVVREFENFLKDQGEIRVWWVDNQPVMFSPHPDTPDSLPEVDDGFLDDIRQAVVRLDCPFVTTDLAQREDGVWRVIEASDGQVSGVPRGWDSTPLYRALLGI